MLTLHCCYAKIVAIVCCYTKRSTTPHQRSLNFCVQNAPQSTMQHKLLSLTHRNLQHTMEEGHILKISHPMHRAHLIIIIIII